MMGNMGAGGLSSEIRGAHSRQKKAEKETGYDRKACGSL